PAFPAPFFKEYAVKTRTDPGSVIDRLGRQGIAAGPDLGPCYGDLSGHLLVAVTEKRTKAEIDLLAAALAG
ncbi:glycine dehydrogenase, partial [bacterium]|nr:glycine dehydrogenase [bacterium]